MSKARNLRRADKQQAYIVQQQERDKRYEEARAKIQDMVDRNYDKGFTEGKEVMLNLMLAGMCLAANSEFGFGAQRLYRLMNATVKNTMNYLTTKEAVQAVYDITGLEIVPDDPFDAVQQTHKPKRGKLVSLRRANSDSESAN